uniref:Ankyrin repeat and sterile alpha motif domain containing 3 n=1 Tax=Pan paniscus TaxID=9597 RepID=A0A2R9BV76_PANPA
MSELSDEASEPELLNRSLSMWHGLGTQVSREELDVPLDLHTAASIGQYEVVKECVQRESRWTRETTVEPQPGCWPSSMDT